MPTWAFKAFRHLWTRGRDRTGLAGWAYFAVPPCAASTLPRIGYFTRFNFVGFCASRFAASGVMCLRLGLFAGTFTM